MKHLKFWKKLLAAVLVLTLTLAVFPASGIPVFTGRVASAAGGAPLPALNVTDATGLAKATVSIVRTDSFYVDDMINPQVYWQVYDVNLSIDKAYPFPVSVKVQVLNGSDRDAKRYTVSAVAGGDVLTIPPDQTTTYTKIGINEKYTEGSDAETRWSGSRCFVIQVCDPINCTLADGGVTAAGSANAARNNSSFTPVKAANGMSLSYIVKIAGSTQYGSKRISTAPDETPPFFIGTSDYFTNYANATFLISSCVVDLTTPFSLSDIPGYSAFLNALQDSNASGVSLGVPFEVGYHGIEKLTQFFQGAISPLDVSGNMIYDANDYAGWPQTLGGYSFVFNTLPYSCNTFYPYNYFEWTSNVYVDSSGFTTAVYTFPMAKFMQYGNTPLKIKFYNLYAPTCVIDTKGTTLVYVDSRFNNNLSLTMVDFIPPVVTSISAPAGVTYRAGDIIPITLAFSEVVSVPSNASITVNGQSAPCAGAATGKYATFLYTVQGIDNANTLNIAGIGAGLAADIFGNALSQTPVGGEGLDLNSPYTITGMDIKTPLPSQAIAGLSADKTSYNPGDAITVTLTDNADSRFSAWLRNTVDTQNGNILGGAYIAVRNKDGGLDTYPLAVADDSGASVVYAAQIPTGLYAPYGSSLQIALFYSDAANGSPVSRDAATGVFSGGQIDYGHLFSVGLTQPNYVTAVNLDTAVYPAGNIIHIGGYTPVTLKATLTAEDTAYPPTYPAITWSSSDESVATIDPDTGVILPVGTGTVTFTATAANNGIGTPVTATTPAFTVDMSGPPTVFFAQGMDSFKIRKGDPLTVQWITNLVYADTAFTVTVTDTATNLPVYTNTYGKGGLTGPAVTIDGSLLTKLSGQDSSMNFLPAYTVTVSAANPDNPAQTLSAAGKIVVYPQPASVRFSPLASTYITDATASVSVEFTMANLIPGTDQLALVVYRNGDTANPVYTQSTFNDGYNSFSLPISPVAGGQLKDVYTISAIATNATGPCSDATKLYVYNQNALKIMVTDAAGTQAEMTGGTLTLSNQNQIATLYNTGGSAAILDLQRDISLQRYISINYGDYAWGAISDQIAWLSDNTATATVNYRQGTAYEPLSSFTFTKYAPGTTFSLAGVSDGSAKITATHAVTGQEVTLNVDVKTLTNKLYLFQFYPKLATKVSYVSGDGTTKNLTSDADGALAVYDPAGISGNVTVQSGNGGTVYLGTVYNDLLKSGENDSANRGLYPVNIMQLRSTNIQVYLKNPDGTAWSGSAVYYGAVYKNGQLCPDTVISALPVAVGGDGLFSLNLDASKFWVNKNTEVLGMKDKLLFQFILECGSGNQYYPVYMNVDGNLNTVDVVNTGANVAALRDNTSGKPNAYVASQSVTGTNIIGTIDVLTSTANVGPGPHVPEEALVTTVLWWGQDTSVNYGASMQTPVGADLQSQTVKTYKLPYYDAEITIDTVILNETTIGPGSLLDFKPGHGSPMRFVATNGDGGLAFSQNTTFRILNGIGLPDPVSSGRIAGQITTLEEQVNNDPLDQPDINDVTSQFSDTLHMMENIKYIVSVLTFGDVVITYEPTPDPLLYYAFLSAGAVSAGKYSVNMGVSGAPGNSQGGGFYLKAEVRFDQTKDDYDLQIVEGGISLSVGFSIPLGSIVVWPFPVISISPALELGVKMAVQIHRDDKVPSKTDNLMSMVLSAGLKVKAGVGAAGDDVGFFVGFYGTLTFNAYLALLNMYSTDLTAQYNNGQDMYETFKAGRLSLDGSVGFEAEIDVLIFSKSFSYEFFSWHLNLKDYGYVGTITKYINDHGLKDDLGFTKTNGITTVALARAVNALYLQGNVAQAQELLYSNTNSFGEMQSSTDYSVQSRDYLTTGARTWGQAPSRLRSLTPGAITNIQSNANPKANPIVSGDGSLMVYVSDGNSTDINDSNISYAVGGASGYADKGAIDKSATVLPAASGFDFSGNSSFAAAVWTAESQPVAFADAANPTDAEINAAVNNSETVASIYSGGAWTTTRLTDNASADMSPAVAANNGRAIAVWHSRAGTGSSGGDINTGDVSDRLVCCLYDGSSWSGATVLMSDASDVQSLKVSMLPDGTAAVVYAIDTRGNGNQADFETYCMIVDGSGTPVSVTRLSNGSGYCQNPQVQAVINNGVNEFLAGWYESAVDGSGNITGGNAEFAAVGGDGSLDQDLTSNLNSVLAIQQLTVGSNFTFASDASGDLNGLSLLWDQLIPPIDTTSASSAQLNGVKINRDTDGSYYFTTPQTVALTAEQNQFRSFGGWFDKSTDTLNAVMEVADLTHTRDAVPVSASFIGQASASFANNITAGADVNQDEIVHDFQTAFPFHITNTGCDVLNKVTITLSDGTTQSYTGLHILPGVTQTLNRDYLVPAAKNAIKDLDYDVLAGFTGGGTADAGGTLNIAIPNVGITTVTPVSAGNGLRTFTVSLQNRSSVEFDGNKAGYAAWFGVYTDISCTQPAPDALGRQMVYQITGGDLALLDGSGLTKQLIFALPATGFANGDIRLYVRGWAEDSGGNEIAQYYRNGSGSILFTDPVAANGGNPIQITTSMDNSSGGTVATVTVTNLSMTPQTNGNLTVTLLGPDGGVLDTKLYTTDPGGLITLGPEGGDTFTFTFSQAGYSVQAGYYTADPADMNADLASLQLTAVAVAFDKNTLSYDLSAQNIGSTTLTAAAVNPAASVSVLDSSGNILASGTGMVSYGLKLPSRAETDVKIQVQPVSGGAVKTYALNITNTVGGSGGIVISASGNTVTVTNTDTTGFVPAEWQVCTDGAWSAKQNWNTSGSNSFQMRSEPFTSMYVRVYDANGTYMDSNSLSSAGIYCTVTFDPNGGARTGGGGLIQTILSGNPVATPTVTRDGYTFAGWFTAASGGTQVPAGAVFTADATVYAHWETAGGTTYTVTFNANSGFPAITTMTVTAPATTVGTLPTPPVRTNYTFASWNTQADGSGTAFTASTPVAANITVYAQWTYTGGNGGGTPYIPPATTTPAPTVPPASGNVTKIGDNTVTTPQDQNPVHNPDGTTTLPGGGTITTPGGTIITVPAGTVIDSSGNVIKLPNGSAAGSIKQKNKTTTVNPGLTITITNGKITSGGFQVAWQNPFADVHPGDWFYKDAEYMYTHGLIAGTAANKFSPQMKLTRSMIVTILYHEAGNPDVSKLVNPFSDVPGGTWYTNAVKWAAANGIVFGIGGEKYAPDVPITRQDLTVILYLYAQYAGITLPATKDYTGFTDDADIANYAKDAIDAFFKAGIISGYPDGSVKPTGTATRAEVAAILHRFLELTKSE